LTLNTVAFPGPLAEGQGHVSYLLFTPYHFFGRNRLTQQSVVAHDPDPPDA
jgi:hypothetical protein